MNMIFVDDIGKCGSGLVREGGGTFTSIVSEAPLP